MTPKEAAIKITEHGAAAGDIAIVFGRESKGLKNEELQQCQYHVNIPTSDAYSSLNLAMAVRSSVMSCFARSQACSEERIWDQLPATNTDLEHFFAHLEGTLAEVGFHDPDNPRQLLTRLRRLFLRIEPDQMEISILRGFFKGGETIRPKANPSVLNTRLKRLVISGACIKLCSVGTFVWAS